MKIEKPRSKQPIPAHAKLVFKGKIFDTYQWEQKMFDGSIEIFEKIKRADTVNIIAITAKNRIIALDQEQPGGDSFISVPGGRVDDDEDVLAAAKRELLEETGFMSDDWTLWASVQPYAKSEWACYTFLAKNCVKQTDNRPDAGEKITVRQITLEEFINIVYSDDFRDKEVLNAFLKAKLRTENNPDSFEIIKKLFLK